MDQKKEPQLTQLAELMQTECSNMLRYACCRLGDREEARDALQDVYLSVHSQICGDRGIRILDLKSYFFRTLANHCIDRLQSRAKTTLISLDDVPDVADMPNEYTEKDYARVTMVLATLPDEQAEVIRLRIYAEKSFVEIAAILALPLSTVKSRFIYGLKKMRMKIDRNEFLSI